MDDAEARIKIAVSICVERSNDMLKRTLALVVAFGVISITLHASDRDAAVKGNTQFAFDLYNQVKKADGGDKHVVFSPVSISTALAMTYAGARGETEKQMAQTLHFTAKKFIEFRIFLFPNTWTKNGSV